MPVTRFAKVQPFTGAVTETAHGWTAWRCTPWGWVDMRAAQPPDDIPFAVLVFVHNGYRYERVYHQYYTVIGASRLATAFVNEIVNNTGENT